MLYSAALEDNGFECLGHGERGEEDGNRGEEHAPLCPLPGLILRDEPSDNGTIKVSIPSPPQFG